MRARAIGFILAGGQSRRMGREKPLQEVGGVPLVERVVTAMTGCVGSVTIVANRPDLYDFLGLTIIGDERLGRGPIAGIEAALRRAGGEPALIVAGDYPFLTEAALERIVNERPSASAVVPRIEGHLHPLCALYGKEALAAVVTSLESGELMVGSFVARLPDPRILGEEEFGGRIAASRTFMNVNTPEDLERAEALVAGTHSR